MISAAIDVIESEHRDTAVLAAQGLHPWTRFATDGSLGAFAAEAQWIRQTKQWWISGLSEHPT